MKNRNWKTCLSWILLTETVGIVAGWFTREGVRIFQEFTLQPPLSPPGILFPIAWTILYALMGVSAARIYLAQESPERAQSLMLFGVQLAFNFLWSFVFFNAQAYGFAFLWILVLWGLILWMIISFRQVDSFAAWLQIPYLIWVTFAAYLNLGVWLLNG